MKNKLGFTLIELMVVISIIGSLATAGLTLFNNVSKNARDSRRRADIKAIALALEQYKTQNGNYPYDPTAGWMYSNQYDDAFSGPQWLTDLVTSGFMRQLPTDPTNSQNCGGYSGGCYVYAYFQPGTTNYGSTYAGSTYALLTQLESPSTKDRSTKCIMPDGQSFVGGDLAANCDSVAVPGCFNGKYTNKAALACGQQ